jgi:hypothetical protein
MVITLIADLLGALERRKRPEPAHLVFPLGLDAEATGDLLVREAIGGREVDLLLLQRKIARMRSELEAARRNYVVWDRAGEPETGNTPAEASHLAHDLPVLEARQAALEAELAALRGPEGRARARTAMAGYRLVRYEDRDRAVAEAQDAPVFVITRVSHGLRDRMAERLRARGAALGLPEGHEDTVLLEDERQKWGGPSPDADQD